MAATPGADARPISQRATAGKANLSRRPPPTHEERWFQEC
jgi:hypothetical protein